VLELIDPLRVLSGSPGHEHGYVPLTRWLELREFDILQPALRDRPGGDADSKISGNDLLRLVGTLNYKPTVPPDGTEPSEPTPVVLLPGGGRPWAPEALAELLDIDLSAPVRNSDQPPLGPLAEVPTPNTLPHAVITVLERHRDNRDRSAATHAVITACRLARLSRAESFAVIRAHVPAVLDKYGDRLAIEFDRSWGMSRRTGVMEAVSTTLESFPDGLTSKQVREHVKCRRDYALDALKILKADKYVTSEPYIARSKYPLWVSVKPYRQEADPLSVSGGDGPSEESE
jgi:hypothetical protein